MSETTAITKAATVPVAVERALARLAPPPPDAAELQHLAAARAQGGAEREAWEEARSLLQECLTDYGHPNFTDRHGTADRLRACLRRLPSPQGEPGGTS